MLCSLTKLEDNNTEGTMLAPCPWGKLMRLESPNRIDVIESNLKSDFDRRIIVDSDSNDLIESTITILI